MKSCFCYVVASLQILLVPCSSDDLEGSAASQPEARDPWIQPYKKNSIWNQPIGSAAEYVPVELIPTKGAGIDVKFFLELDANDPVRQTIGFDRFAPPEGRCAGTTDMKGLTVRLPDGWMVPDIGPENPFGRTPNSSFVFLMPDRKTAWIGPAIARCDPTGPLYMFSFQRFENNRKYDDMRGDGVEGTGGQGASAMSGLGGTIRLGELTGEKPIRHAIKINPWGRHLFYSDELPGFRWPAKAADQYANEEGHKNRYVGEDPNLVMGTLLTIPPDVTAEDLGLESEPAKKLLFTLQNYGAYITEDAGWDVLDFIIERGVEVEFEEHWGFSMESEQWAKDVVRLASRFHAVTNNEPESIGGGGEPLQPLAPDLIQ